MEKEQLKQAIIDLIEQSLLGSVATVEGDKPHVRYMIIRHTGDLKLFAATYAKGSKISQIEKNHNVEIIMGGDAQNWEKPYITIRGTARVCTDQETKTESWDEKMENYFSGPDDPNYAVIVFQHQIIEYMAPGAMRPEIYTV